MYTGHSGFWYSRLQPRVLPKLQTDTVTAVWKHERRPAGGNKAPSATSGVVKYIYSATNLSFFDFIWLSNWTRVARSTHWAAGARHFGIFLIIMSPLVCWWWSFWVAVTIFISIFSTFINQTISWSWVKTCIRVICSKCWLIIGPGWLSGQIIILFCDLSVRLQVEKFK